MKTLIFIFFIILLINISFSFYLWKENQRNRQNIVFLENKMDRLDIDALEKIKNKNEVEINCENIESSDWLAGTFCN